MTSIVEKASFRLATEADKHLETYDNTKLQAMNTCPTWGIVRYQMHKTFKGGGRAMPLECGAAMHEAFSYVRLVTLKEQLGGDTIAARNMYNFHGVRLFGVDRWGLICDETGVEPDRDMLAKRGSIAVLETSGFYDDPRDKRRTLTNMETCMLAYVDRWRWDQPVWIRNPSDLSSDVGIEIPFDVVVTIHTTPSTFMEFRLTGKIDAIHVHGDNKITLHENKTAARLNDAWAMSFAMSSQVTGYCVAASVFTEQQVRNAKILGISVPLPVNYDFNGIMFDEVSRSDYHIKRWLEWLVHTIDMARTYKDNPFDAPKYTHSCNRYFRPCSLIPFCDSEDEDQRLIINEMVTEEWSPLHEKELKES